jgi:hypothetical protein
MVGLRLRLRLRLRPTLRVRPRPSLTLGFPVTRHAYALPLLLTSPLNPDTHTHHCQLPSELPRSIQKFAFWLGVTVRVTAKLNFPCAFLASPGRPRGSSTRTKSPAESRSRTRTNRPLARLYSLHSYQSSLPPLTHHTTLHRR